MKWGVSFTVSIVPFILFSSTVYGTLRIAYFEQWDERSKPMSLLKQTLSSSLKLVLLNYSRDS